MNVEMSTTLQPGRRLPMSWDEYVDVDVRGEYIDGELVVSAMPTRRHQVACQRLIEMIGAVLPEGVDVVGSWGWKPGRDEFGPDVMVFDETDEDVRYTGIPHLCVEVRSADPGADLVRKMAKYAQAGLPRYWVVDPARPELVVFELGDTGYREVARLIGEEPARLDLGSTTVELSPSQLVS